MSASQGDLALLRDPVAQQLLTEQTILRLAYTWIDGTPRVVPHWFVWNGREIVLGTQTDAPKLKALPQNPQVALTIDTTDYPPKVLLIRGTARLAGIVDGVAPEYAEAARRYFGEEQAAAFVQQIVALAPRMARVVITPEWAAILDYETRFPSALARAMRHARGGAG